MRKIIIITCLVLSGLMILDSLHIGEVLMMFLLAGVIPGTKIALSATVMMELFGLAIGIVVGRLCSRAVRPYFERLLLQVKRA